MAQALSETEVGNDNASCLHKVVVFRGKEFQISLNVEDSIRSIEERCKQKIRHKSGLKNGNISFEGYRLLVLYLSHSQIQCNNNIEKLYLLKTEDLLLQVENQGLQHIKPMGDLLFCRIDEKTGQRSIGVTAKDRIRTVLEKIRDTFCDEIKDRKIKRLLQNGQTLFNCEMQDDNELFKSLRENLKLDVAIDVITEVHESGSVHFVHNVLGKRKVDYKDDATLEAVWCLLEPNMDTPVREVRVKSRSVFSIFTDELENPLSLTFKDCQLKNDDIVEFITDTNLRFPNSYKVQLRLCSNDFMRPKFVPYKLGMTVFLFKKKVAETYNQKFGESNDVLFHQVNENGREFLRPLYDPEQLPFIEGGGSESDSLLLMRSVKFLDLKTKQLFNIEVVWPWIEAGREGWATGLFLRCEKGKDERKFFFLEMNDGSYSLCDPEKDVIIKSNEDPFTCKLEALVPPLPKPQDAQREVGFFITFLNTEQMRSLKKGTKYYMKCTMSNIPEKCRSMCGEFWFSNSSEAASMSHTV